jgi:histidinol phosphatase-like enzyme
MHRTGDRFVLIGQEGVISRRSSAGCIRECREFEFLPGALDGLRYLNRSGYRVLSVSNWDCTEGEGKTVEECKRLTRRMLLEVALAGGNIDGFYDIGSRTTGKGTRRVALEELLRRAILEHQLSKGTNFISDSEVDLAAARQVGCSTILLRREAFLNSEWSAEARSDLVVSNLREAAEFVISPGAAGIVLRTT